MELHHFFHDHPLTFSQYEVYADSISDCNGCCEEILGFSYNCKMCEFLLHKSCGEQPRELQHPLHPQHPLILHTTIRDHGRCYFCNQYTLGGFSYYCSQSCNFQLHLKCASYPFTVKTEFHDHPLNLLRKLASFTCDVCGKKDEDMLYLCVNITCPLMVHLKCAALPLAVKHISHHHALNLTHTSDQLNQSNRLICRLCVKKVDTERVYYCSKCNFVAHLDCATLEGNTDETFTLGFKDKQPLESTGMLENEDSELDESSDSLAYVVKKINPGEDKIEIAEEIKHFSHQHDLKLTDQLLNNKRCDGCMLPIFPPFYTCAQCNFFLHKPCVGLPRKKRHPLHFHLLTLLVSPYRQFFSSGFLCNVCRVQRHGFSYHCEECYFDANVPCSLISDVFSHEGYEHLLILSRASNYEKCSCCGNYGKVFRCADCEFTLDLRCATLPRMVGYRYFEQPFKLCYNAEDESDECYCDICEKERNPKHWFYYCVDLNFPAHPSCILRESRYKK